MPKGGFDFSVALVGSGNMGGAMLAGWLERGLDPHRVVVVDPSPPGDKVKTFESLGVRFEITAVGSIPVDVVVVAVKPQVMDVVLPTLAPIVSGHTVVVSVAAGKTLGFMEEKLGEGAHVRAMPNTPALIGKGATIAIANERVSKQQKAHVAALLSANGIFDWVEDEALIDSVTALSGSGPAYVFHLAECMTAAGIDLGLAPDMAAALARQTIAGAGEMMASLDDSAEQLRINVTSPGGTTQAALSVLMENDAMKNLFARAMTAARDRSIELS